MSRFQTAMLAVVILLLCNGLLDASVAQTKLLLSEAIRNAIDTHGIESAKKQFAESYKSQKDQYDIDTKGLSELTSAYAQAGNIEAAGAVMAIATPYIQDQIAAQMGEHSPEFAQRLAEGRRAEKEKKAKATKKREDEQRVEQNALTNSQGESRNDLERFTGLFGDPEEKDKNRRLWVTVSCDGYLVSGALWGDASPWWMTSAGDKIFTYQDSFSKLRMEFETGANGKALRMTHDLSFMKSPLERLGPLPDDWEPCVERAKR